MKISEQSTNRRDRFVEEYTRDLNATQAAIRAGYSPSTARFIACELMRVPEIRAAIEEKKKELTETIRLDALHVLQELIAIAKSDITRYKVDEKTGEVTVPPGYEDATLAIQRIKRRTRTLKSGCTVSEVEIVLWSKIEALRMLGNYLNMWQSGEAGQQSTITVLAGFDEALALGLKTQPRLRHSATEGTEGSSQESRYDGPSGI